MEIICPAIGVSRLHPKQGLADLQKAGFMDVAFSYGLWVDVYRYEKRRKLLRYDEDREPFFQAAREAGVKLPLAYAPALSFETKRPDLFGFIEEETKAALRDAAARGVEAVVVPPLAPRERQTHEALWELNRAYYLRLAAACGANGPRILLTNMLHKVNGHMVRGLLSEAEEAVDWMDALNREAGEERFGFLLDIGKANLCGQDFQALCRTLGKRLMAVTVTDGSGRTEQHLLPFTAVSGGRPQTDWLGLIRGLRDSAFDGMLVFDFTDTAAACSALLLPSLLAYARKVADFLAWQVGLENVMRRHANRVLFGAGRMCARYMREYGEKYPPLFTCDNNQARWGEVFEGLRIEPPEKLRGLPPDCAVFICNTYYREIEAQLRGMGLKNPIEFFNDEYMPHTDHLKMEGEVSDDDE